MLIEASTNKILKALYKIKTNSVMFPNKVATKTMDKIVLTSKISLLKIDMSDQINSVPTPILYTIRMYKRTNSHQTTPTINTHTTKCLI